MKLINKCKGLCVIIWEQGGLEKPPEPHVQAQAWQSPALVPTAPCICDFILHQEDPEQVGGMVLGVKMQGPESLFLSEGTLLAV